MLEVGERIAIEGYEEQKICEGDECTEVVLKLGRLYVFRGEVESPRPPADPGEAVWNVIKSVRSQYPGVSITYIWMSDDWRRFEVHLFDPGVRPAVAWTVIAVLVLILAIIVAATVFVNVTGYWIVKVAKEVPEEVGIPKSKWFWWAIVGIAGIVAATGLVKALRK